MRDYMYYCCSELFSVSYWHNYVTGRVITGVLEELLGGVDK